MGLPHGTVALITGAGRGIGLAIAQGLAADGAAVAINDRDSAEAEAACAEVERAGGRAMALPFSVTDFDAANDAVSAVVESFGHVNILVSNAGIASSGKSVLRTPIAEAEDLMRLNCFAAMVLSQLVLPSMRAQGAGRIVMMSSLAATAAPPKGGPYAMAKAALETLAFTLAKEEARHGIRVNVIAPALVDTRLGHLIVDRGASVAEDAGAMKADLTEHMVPAHAIADAVRFLVSPSARHVSGERLVVGSLPTPG